MKRKINNFWLGTLLLFVTVLQAGAQNVAVSPSRLYYKVGIGEYKSHEVTVKNSSKTPQAFKIFFADFESKGNQGKTTLMKKGESEHSCSNWLSASPSFFELGPGESQKVEVLLQVPNTPEANKVKWAVMNVKLAREKKAPAGEGNSETVGFGIVQTFQFIIHIFQTPPTVTYADAEIVGFKEITKPTDDTRTLSLEVSNTGETILNCASYLELTNLQNGEIKRLDVKAFTVLPDGRREIYFQLPVDLKKGQYSVLGVVDYGSKEKIAAAEMDLTVP